MYGEKDNQGEFHRCRNCECVPPNSLCFNLNGLDIFRKGKQSRTFKQLLNSVDAASVCVGAPSIAKVNCPPKSVGV